MNTATQTKPPDTDTMQSRTGKYLTLVLGNEIYGVDVLKIQEIIGMMDVTNVPQTPQFVKGVINLRGKVIPIIDLRLKFGMEEKVADDETCIIVVNVGSVLMGIIVDTVHEVADIAEEQIEDPPKFGAAVDTAFILGMGKMDNKVIILLDIDSVLNDEDLSAIKNIADE